jgi:cation:H+ antiporter
MLALFTAGSEFLISVTSAIRDVFGIGLGMVFGSSIIHVPAIVTVAYFATRQRHLGKNEETVDTEEKPENHEQHVDEHLLRVHQEAVTVLVLPYLALVVLIGILTLSASWRGLQPVDGLILSGLSDTGTAARSW